MKSRLRHSSIFCLFLATALIFGLFAATNTDSQSPQAINVVPQKCGLSIIGLDAITVNDDDDDKDENWDLELEPVPGETSTYKYTVKAKADKTPAAVTITLLDGADLVDYFWEGTLKNDGTTTGSEDAGREKQAGAKKALISFTVLPGKSAIQTFYLEGIKNSVNESDFATIKVNLSAPEITVGTTRYPSVDKNLIKNLLDYRVDIDVDSNNNEGYDFTNGSYEEDEIEASDKVVSGALRPGKMIFSSPNADGDGDGIPDFADLATASQRFVPVLVKLPPPLDPATTMVSFDYLESKPENSANGYTRAGSGTPTAPYTYTLNKGGIRLWKIDAAARASGDYVPSRASDINSDLVVMPWSAIAQTGSREVKLYIEYVDKLIPESGGRRSITFAALESGSSEFTDGICSDKVVVTLLPIDIEPDANMVGVVGDVVKSAKIGSAIEHFVTPKKSSELAQDYVELKAVGVDNATFSQLLEWEGGEAGSTSDKRKVKRDAIGKTEVKIKAKQGGSVAAQMNVWAVWAVGEKVADRPIQSVYTNIKTGDGTTGPGLGISGGYDFKFTIVPDSIIKDSERPELSGINKNNGSNVDPPGAGMQHFIYGTDLKGGATLKWDVSRRIKAKVLNPKLYGKDKLDDVPGVLWNAQPTAQDIPVAFPGDGRIGNDDTTVGDEDCDPYASSSATHKSHAIGEISSTDFPNQLLRNSTGSDGDTFELRYHFGEFSRILIGNNWYRVSDFFDWRAHFKLKRQTGAWADDGSDTSLDNANF